MTSPSQNKTLDQFKEIAKERGVGALFDSALFAARQHTLQVARRVNVVMFNKPSRENGTTPTVVSLFLNHDEHPYGKLLVGFATGALKGDPSALPGVRADRPKHAYNETDNGYRYLSTSAEVLALMSMF